MEFTNKTVTRVQARWAGERKFDTGRPRGPIARLDGSGETGQSPVDAVLSALASCSGIDVVEILAKRRTPVESLEVDVEGERADGTPGAAPKRLTHITLTFRIKGKGIEREQAERAIDLSINKYCSVRDSLDRDIAVEWKLELLPD